MLKDSQVEVGEHRFQPYLEELREFLASRGVGAGKPADIAAFAQRIAEGGPFEEEMGAIVRSVVYRESEHMGRGELLEMLTSAVGGPGLDGVAPGMQDNVRTIFLFLNKALRQQRPSYRPESAPERVAVLEAPVSRLESSEPESPVARTAAPLPSRGPAVAGAPPEPSRAGQSPMPVPGGVDAMAGSGPDPLPEAKQAPAQGFTAPVRENEASPRPILPERTAAPASDSTPRRGPHPFSPWVTTGRADDSPLPAPSAGASEERAPANHQTPGSHSPRESDVLYRALSLSADPALDHVFDDLDEEEAGREAVPRRGWLVPAVAGGLAVLGLAAFLGRPFFGPTHRPAVTGNVAGVASSGAVSCSSPMLAGSSRSGLEERSRWAHNLLDQKLYDAALPELREIARMDPGFPGIGLDESDALLHLKRPDEARAAVDEQISTSHCLAALAPPALDAYCSLHYPAATRTGCQAQMARISQQAELQAALVHLELGHRVQPMADADVFSELGSSQGESPPTQAWRGKGGFWKSQATRERTAAGSPVSQCPVAAGRDRVRVVYRRAGPVAFRDCVSMTVCDGSLPFCCLRLSGCRWLPLRRRSGAMRTAIFPHAAAAQASTTAR